ncbi:MAG: response regulator [Ktedonobacterales bacterium]
MERESQKPILIVDDDETILSTIEFLLVDAGYPVILASNGKEALACAKQQPPCLILLDMKMPVMDGWAFVRAYREEPEPHAPIIMMTAAHEPASRAEAIAADAYIAKPFNIDQLLALVHRYAPQEQ